MIISLRWIFNKQQIKEVASKSFTGKLGSNSISLADVGISLAVHFLIQSMHSASVAFQVIGRGEI